VLDGGQDLKNVCVYRQCLSPDEIKELYESERAALLAEIA
jgi:hypothetical protein